MRVCFDTFCFTSRLNTADEEATADGLVVGSADPIQHQITTMMVNTPDVQQMLQNKDDKIKELETKLRLREEEIIQLKSHLDKFQSVFPFSLNATGKHIGLNNNVGPRPRKQRAQGISAEPQSAASIQELSRQTFQTYDKNER